jgi:uncharacterized protein YqgV (UPF0045/DUF77 family)
VTCQFSIYPLGVAELGPPIAAALEAIRGHGLQPELGPMSSLVSGPLDDVLAALGEAFRVAAAGGCVMVLTLSNACPAG